MILSIATPACNGSVLWLVIAMIYGLLDQRNFNSYFLLAWYYKVPLVMVILSLA